MKKDSKEHAVYGSSLLGSASMTDAVRDARLAARREKRRAQRSSAGDARLSRDATRKMFRDLRNTLDDIHKFEEQARYEELMRKPVEELTPEDVDYFDAHQAQRVQREPGESMSEYVSRRRADLRDRLLAKLVPERKCPVCGATRTKSRSWVVISKAMLRGVFARVASGDVTLQDAGRVKKKPVCCLSCWRARLSRAPNDRTVRTADEQEKR